MTKQDRIKKQFEMAVRLNLPSICSCGEPSTSWSIVLMLLERAEEGTSFATPMVGADEHWVEFAAKVLDGWGLLTHGSNIMYALLTPDGEEILGWLRFRGTDPDNWPEWWMDLTPPEQGRQLGKEALVN